MTPGHARGDDQCPAEHWEKGYGLLPLPCIWHAGHTGKHRDRLGREWPNYGRRKGGDRFVD